MAHSPGCSSGNALPGTPPAATSRQALIAKLQEDAASSAGAAFVSEAQTAETQLEETREGAPAVAEDVGMGLEGT